MKTQAAVLILTAFVLALVLPVVAPSPAFAFYCDGHLVQVGDSVESLYANCGAPTVKLTPREEGGETWIYNQGSSDFQIKVSIFNNQVTAIEQGNYGYGPSKPLSQ
jgi:hypothetical protein